jgi:endonuclease/exonuclease/phosphatase family metal-dependent hydrolase
MSDPKNRVYVTRDSGRDMPETPGHERRLLVGLPGEQFLHDQSLNDLQVLHYIERGGRPSSEDKPKSIRLAAWNIARCPYPSVIGTILARERSDVILLSETDLGMAGTGQQHLTRSIVGPLGHEFLFGVEFMELGLGNELEARMHDGKSNLRGLHGNAVSSSYPLQDPVMIRFDTEGAWFSLDAPERRIGGRMAVAAKLSMEGGDVVFVSIHMESLATSEQRAVHLKLILNALEEYAPGAPMVIGGDLNTDCDAWTLGQGTKKGTDEWDRLAQRSRDPVRYEPLFGVALEAGFTWETANGTTSTVRDLPYLPTRVFPHLKLDWFFTRGVTASAPRTVPAVDGDGDALSDHDLILVDIALAS